MNDDEEQTVNHEVLRQQIEQLLEGGVHGLFPFGTNGEGYILSMKEKEEVLETVIDQVHSRVPVYAGTGCLSTADTIYLSKGAEKAQKAITNIQRAFKFGNPNTVIKKAVAMMGYPVGDCRRPFNYLCEEGVETLKQVLKEDKENGTLLILKGINYGNKTYRGHHHG